MLRGFFRRITDLITQAPRLDDALFDEMEELLIASDVSVRTAETLVGGLRAAVRERRATDAAGVRRALEESIAAILSRHRASLAQPGAAGLTAYLVVGVNGTGKTTTIAKLARRFTLAGHRGLLAAADTFRAAAIEQLEIWGQRVGVDVVRHQPGGDPAAVVFDALQSARARGLDFVIADTAGRLHTKRNLMEELRKIARVGERELGRPLDETLLVLDATTGQNALAQAREFSAAAAVSGIVLTKLDGTAKGGAIITIADETTIPIKLIGTGEGLEDLTDFDPEAYARSLFEEEPQ